MDGIRIGHGYDSHRFDASRPLVLGGVEIPGYPGLAGHSDADALLHAVTDAILGAAALGDIGMHFPDGDPAWCGADSRRILREAAAKVRAAGWTVGNVDATVICERPKLRPHVDAMRVQMAAALGCPVSAVSVKGKTNEGMDAAGAGEGIVAHCVALLVPAGTAAAR